MQKIFLDIYHVRNEYIIFIFFYAKHSGKARLSIHGQFGPT